MTLYGFIDESGTLMRQQVMTVALVLLDGKRSAEKLHLKMVSAIFSPPKNVGREVARKYLDSRYLHYAEMDHKQKMTIAEVLQNAKVQVIVGYCHHSQDSVAHSYRHEMYSGLVMLTINEAFDMDKDLVVAISKQGGYQGYGPKLIASLNQLSADRSSEGNYCKGDFFLTSPAKHGQQIADFYASSSWNFLQQSENTSPRTGPFACLQDHVTFKELILKTKSETEASLF